MAPARVLPEDRLQPIQSIAFVFSFNSHLTNSNECGNLQIKVLLTCPRIVPPSFTNSECTLKVIDFLLLYFHRLLNPFFRNSFVFTSICVAPCYFRAPLVGFHRAERSRSTTHVFSMDCPLFLSLLPFFARPSLWSGWLLAYLFHRLWRPTGSAPDLGGLLLDAPARYILGASLTTRFP